jgi:MFS family permease
MPPAIHLLVLTVFIDLIGFGIIIPLLPLYAETFHAGAFTIGLLMACFSFWQFVFAPILGAWSDRIGRRPVLLISLLGTILGYIPLAVADRFPQHVAALGGIPLGLLLLFLSRTVDGISGGNISTAQAYIADITTPEDRVKGMGMIGAAFGMGFIFGPVIGSVLVRYGFHWPALAAMFLAAVNWIWAWRSLPESLKPGCAPAERKSPLLAIARSLGNPRVATLILIVFVATFAFANLEATLTLYLKDRLGLTAAAAAPRTGVYFAYIGFLMALIQGGAIRRLRGKHLERALVVGGTLCFAIGLFGMALVTNTTVLLIPLAFVAFGSGFVNPSLTSLISQHAEPGEMGETIGASQGMSGLARILGPLAAGILYGKASGALFPLDPGRPYLVAGIVMTLAFLLALGIKRSRIPALAETPTGTTL